MSVIIKNKLNVPCYISFFEGVNGELVRKTYDCYEVKKLFPEWKTKFREENKTDQFSYDKAYEMYCNAIQEFIDQCKCES